MTTLAVARRQLQDRLDDVQGRRWGPSMLNTWINEGTRDITRRAECNQSVTDLAVPASTQTNSLSTLSNLLRVHRVEWRTTGSNQWVALEPRDINAMDAVWYGSQDTKSTPQVFTLKGTPPALSIIFYPTDPTGGTARIWWWRLSTEVVADADVIDLPDGWHDVALDYAEYRALRRDSDPRWKEAFELYKDNLASLVEQTRRFTDQNGMVTPDASGLPAWIYDDGYGW
jgi:hypothetical protein